MTRLFAGTPFDIPPNCDDCGKLQSECVCTPAEKAKVEAERRRIADRLSPSEQNATVSLHKRKGGRTATVIEGLTTKANDLPELLAKMQLACGTGGTVKAKQDLIELQGDHVTKVRALLAEIGFRV